MPGGADYAKEFAGDMGVGILTNQNQPVPEPQTGLRGFQDILRRNPVALIILVILGIGVLGLLNNLSSGPSGSVSIPSSNTSTRSPPAPAAAPAHSYEDANAAINRGDFIAAMHIIRPLAEQGDAKAQALLGTMYENGQGVERDYPEAMTWFRRAAEQGEVHARTMIGLMYRDGDGVPRDLVRAWLWLNLSAQSREPADEVEQYTPGQMSAMARDQVAQLMSPAEMAEAHKLANQGWKPEAVAGPPPKSDEPVKKSVSSSTEELAEAQEAPVTNCDKYAASDTDPQRKANDVPFNNVNPALAVPACEAAVRQYPNSTRLSFQLGRAYQKANNLEGAAAQYRKAADQGYGLAQYELGWLYEHGQADLQQLRRGDGL